MASGVIYPHANAGINKDEVFLILDNHNSHTSTKFLNAYRENNVTPLVLPPHTLHILQPFDSFCFVNVIRAYSEESNKT